MDDLTLWAIRRLSAKSSLHEADAEQVNQAYVAKLDGIETSAGDGPSIDGPTAPGPAQSDVVPLQKTVRRRNKSHLTFVASQPCMVCKRMPCDAHHLKFAQPRALGRKVSDGYTVPLCREHHSELHRHANERAWWVNAGLAPIEFAAELWDKTQQREAEALETARTERAS